MNFAALTRAILFLPLEHKIHIFSPPWNILYIYTLGIISLEKFSLKTNFAAIKQKPLKSVQNLGLKVTNQQIAF